MHGQSEPRATATLNRAEEGSRREAKAQDNQSNAKTRNTKSKSARWATPRQDPCRGGPHIPGKSLAGAACLTPVERAFLEPKGSNAINHIGTKAREAPPWRHADLCEDHRYTRSDEDQKTTILGGIPAEEIHKTPGKTLAGDDRC